MQVNIHDECTSRGTLREEGLAATPLLLRVQLQGQKRLGRQRAAKSVKQRRSLGGGPSAQGRIRCPRQHGEEDEEEEEDFLRNPSLFG